MNIAFFAAFVTYFFILLSIGIISHHRQKNAEDFILGNRSLNYWLTSLSAHASDMSAWLFMALPAAIFMGGLPQAWMPVGLLVCMFLNWQFIAKKLREETEKTNSCTLSTYFEKRFNDTSKTLRILTAVMTLVFMTCYLAAGLISMGLLFETVFGLNYVVGLTIAVAVAVTYTFFGGYTTIAWTDLFQALFLLFAILFVPLMAYYFLPDGLTSIQTVAAEKEISLSFFQRSSFISTLTLSLGWGLGYFGQPHILSKFMGIKNPSEIYKSKYLGMSWQFLALSGAIAIGFIGIGFFPEGLVNPETVAFVMIKQLFHPFVAGFILCATLAATMSTMDSQILVTASVISEDLYPSFIKRVPSSKELLIVTRISVVFVALVALFISFMRSPKVLDAVFYAWSGLGCAFGPLILTSLYSKTVNKKGAIAGILVGSFIAFFWPLMEHYMGFQFPSMIPGFFLSLLSILLVSKYTN